MDNQKLLVISDTHGRLKILKTVFEWAKARIPPKDSICAAVFLGDGVSDLELASEATGFSCNWKIIQGNNDYGFQLPDSLVFDFANHRFFICHGHRHNLYNGYYSLINSACANDANIVLFGHIHSPVYKTMNGVHLINPGSIGNPRSNKGATFAVIEFGKNNSFNVEFFGINDDNGKIQNISN